MLFSSMPLPLRHTLDNLEGWQRWLRCIPLLALNQAQYYQILPTPSTRASQSFRGIVRWKQWAQTQQCHKPQCVVHGAAVLCRIIVLATSLITGLQSRNVVIAYTTLEPQTPVYIVLLTTRQVNMKRPVFWSRCIIGIEPYRVSASPCNPRLF